MSNPLIYFSHDSLRAFSMDIFKKLDLSSEDAALVSDCLVKADLRGLGSHGVSRIPLYAKRLRLKLVNPVPEIQIHRVAQSAVHVNGDDGMGMVVGTRAMAAAMNLAKDTGVGMAGVYGSTHFGMAAFYVLQAVKEDLIGFTFTNASPGMAPWGGAKPVLGVNPIAVGVPSGNRKPFVMDMAMSVMARGKMRLAGLRGEPIPENMALDADGNPTTDGLKVHQGGTVLPFGGPKGSALAIWMEIMAGVMTGAAFAGDMKDLYGDFSGPQKIGHMFLAIRADLFMSLDQFKQRMDTMIDRFKQFPSAQGVDEIFMPGEPEEKAEENRLETGIPVSSEIVDMLRQEAEEEDVPFPKPLTPDKPEK